MAGLLFQAWIYQIAIFAFSLHHLISALQQSGGGDDDDDAHPILRKRWICLLSLIVPQVVLLCAEVLLWALDSLRFGDYLLSQAFKLYVWWTFHSWVSGLAEEAAEHCSTLKENYLWRTLLDETTSMDEKAAALYPRVVMQRLPDCYPNDIHTRILWYFVYVLPLTDGRLVGFAWQTLQSWFYGRADREVL